MTATWRPPVDLDNCATEPIHIPGTIQPHGVLIAVSEADMVIAIVSENLAAFFDVEPGAVVVGKSLVDVLGLQNMATLAEALDMDWSERIDEIALMSSGTPLTANMFRSGRYLVIEIESDAQSDQSASRLIREAAMALQSCRTAVEVATAAARWVRSLTGFDRVMVYRFDPEWNGEVIAESKSAELNSFLGLHYPATDIPAQARELYRRNWLRVIPDITYRPVPLISSPSAAVEGPLDLSSSRLRSVSPIHVEYLRNMGVGASMSVSILIGGQLWGLIACHHYSGSHRPSVPARNAAEFLAQLISLRVSETVEADSRRRAIELAARASRVTEALASATQDSVDEILYEHHDVVLGLADATGAVVLAQGHMIGIGVTPPAAEIGAIIAAWPVTSDVFFTDHVAATIPAAAAGGPNAVSGVLVVALSSDRGEYAMWFRPERVRSVDWGGDPHNAKIAELEGDTIRLSPRKSFDFWRATVQGRCAPWGDGEVRSAELFARHVAGAIQRRQRDTVALAKDLQRVMRPAALPSLPDIDFDAFYQPSGVGEVGGDWYDALTIGDHLVAAIVGDVAGHGLQAASEMMQLRNSLRAYVVDNPDPADALERLDRFIFEAMPGCVATAVCAVIDTRTKIMHIAHAGHVPALLIAAGGTAYLPLGDALLGMPPRSRSQRAIQLQLGDAVVLYSDGLIETRRLPIDDGLDRLQHEATRLLADPHLTAPARLLALLLSHPEHKDDITVLVIRLAADRGSSR